MRAVYSTLTGRVFTVKPDGSILTVESEPVEEIYYPRYLTTDELSKAWVNLETKELYFKEPETPA